MLDMVDVVSGEGPAPLVEHQSEPSPGLTGQSHLARIRPEGEVHAIDVQGFPELFAGCETPSIATVGDMNPTIQVVTEAVRKRIADSADKAFDQDLPGIGPAVLVGVPQEKDLGRRKDKQAIPPRQDAGDEAESSSEDRCAIRSAVEVGVLKSTNGALNRPPRPSTVGVVPAFGDKRDTIGVEGDRHRIQDIGFRGPQADLQPGIELKPMLRAAGRRHGHGQNDGDEARAKTGEEPDFQSHGNPIRSP